MYRNLIDKKRMPNKRSIDLRQEESSEATARILEIIRAQHTSR
jgi:hypothetical protein